jgi:hypothetical protein
VLIRPYNAFLPGTIELVASLSSGACALCCTIIASYDGTIDQNRQTAGKAMIYVQLIGLYISISLIFLRGLYLIYELTNMSARKKIGVQLSSSDRLYDAVNQVILSNPTILARRYADRWMVRSLGVGLTNRPVWRRETEDLRALLMLNVGCCGGSGGDNNEHHYHTNTTNSNINSQQKSLQRQLSAVRPKTGSRFDRSALGLSLNGGSGAFPSISANNSARLEDVSTGSM